MNLSHRLKLKRRAVPFLQHFFCKLPHSPFVRSRFPRPGRLIAELTDLVVALPLMSPLRLMPRSPRRRIRLVTVADGLAVDRKPGRVRTTSASLTPATGARTTRFCRTLQRRSSCAPFDRSRTSSPAITLASDAAASTTTCPNVRDDRDTPLSWDRVRES